MVTHESPRLWSLFFILFFLLLRLYNFKWSVLNVADSFFYLFEIALEILYWSFQFTYFILQLQNFCLTTTFLLHPYMIERESMSKISSASSNEGTNLIMRASLTWPHLSPIIFKSHISRYYNMGVGFIIGMGGAMKSIALYFL